MPEKRGKEVGRRNTGKMKAGREGGGKRRRRRREGVLRPKIERRRERGREERGLEKGKGKGRGRKVEEGVSE